MTSSLKPETHNHQLLKTASLFLASIAISFLIISFLSKNDYNVYSLSRLKWLPVPALLIFFALFLIIRKFPIQFARPLNRKALAGYIGMSLLLALIINWFWPFPLPVQPLINHLQIITPGEKNAASTGAVVEIRAVRSLDGARIALDQFSLDGDWVVKDDVLVSQGNQLGSTAAYRGPISGGVLLDLRYGDDAGILNVVLGGQVRQIDLYAKAGATFKTPFELPVWRNAAWSQKMITLLANGLHVIALAYLVFALIWLSQRRWRFFPILLIILYGVVFASYLVTKVSYVQFNAGRAFRDTYSYVEAAEEPLLSKGFWIGKRSFTLPLLYKVIDTDTTNFASKEQLNAAKNVQLSFSVFCWTMLALALAFSMRHPVQRLFVFSLVLFFNVSLEVSFWDTLLLSESISFSLCALLLAGWIGFGWLFARRLPAAYQWLGFALLVVVTILYSFTRDTNLYFVLVGAGILLLASLFGLLPQSLDKKYGYAYIVFVVGLFLFQNVTVQMGNRWQIHIYDHLALRILPDAGATEFFKEAGLPVTADLLAITGMIGYEYHDYLDFDPKMESVRVWIDQYGRATFLKYLLAHPSNTLLEPIRKIDELLNGSNLEYRYPRHPGQPVPIVHQRLTETFYPHQLPILILIAGMCMVSLLVDWRGAVEHRQFLWVLAVLVLSLYPMMVVVWNGNPLEVERHAAQIGIQYRLAGLIALAALLDIAWDKISGRANLEDIKTV